MRLKQLAKEINVTAGLIEEYLTSKLDVSDVTPNTKLSDELISAICKNFKVVLPSNEEEKQVEDVKVDVEFVSSTKKEDAFPNLRKHVEEVKEELKTKQEEVVSSESDNGSALKEERILSFEERMQIEVPDVNEVPEEEVIKAPKVELPGVKVVDKIDLPQPKVKEEQEVIEEVEGEATVVSENGEVTTETDAKVPVQSKPKNTSRRSRVNKKSRGPSFADLREAERLKEIELQKVKDKKLKEARKKYYEENILAKQQEAKKSVKKKKVTSQSTEVVKEAKPEPTTLFGKFLKWLND